EAVASREPRLPLRFVARLYLAVHAVSEDERGRALRPIQRTLLDLESRSAGRPLRTAKRGLEPGLLGNQGLPQGRACTTEGREGPSVAQVPLFPGHFVWAGSVPGSPSG